MRRMLLSAIICMTVMNMGFAQMMSPTPAKIMVTVYDEAGRLIQQDNLNDAAANSFDLTTYLESFDAYARVTVYGHYMDKKEANTIMFDSDKEDIDIQSDLCIVKETTLKPIIGVKVQSTENFDGVIVEKIMDLYDSSVSDFKIGDVIHSVNDINVSTYCDLRAAVCGMKVGQKVPAVVNRKGITETKMVTIGGHIRNQISYDVCSNIEAEAIEARDLENIFEVNVFPNPTRDMAHFSLESGNASPVSIHITDMDGQLIYHKDYQDFSGRINDVFQFQDAAPGTYIIRATQDNSVSRKKILYLGK